MEFFIQIFVIEGISLLYFINDQMHKTMIKVHGVSIFGIKLSHSTVGSFIRIQEQKVSENS